MIDLGVVLAYLGFTLAIGIYQGRNIKSLEDYIIGNRQYPTVVIAATLSATIIGGEATIGLTQKIYTVGAVFIWIFLGGPINKLIISEIIAPRMYALRDMMTVGEIMGSFYGTSGRVITGLAGMILSIGYVAAQVSAVGHMFQYVLDIPYLWGVWLGCGIVVLYSTLGGIKAVTATDIVQFGVLIVAVPVIANMGLKYVDGYGGLLERIPQAHLHLVPEGDSFFKYFGIFLVFCFPFLDPSVTQRMLMAKDTKQIIDAMRTTAFVSILFFLLMGLIGFTALVLFPNVDPHLALPHLINETLPAGLRGLALAGLLAVMMSTSDSYLNVAAVGLIHDVIKPFRDMSVSSELRWAKGATFIMGISAIIVSINFQSAMDIILGFLNVWGPIICVPLIAGIFGIKASEKAFLFGATAGAATSLLWKVGSFESALGLDALLPSILANALFFFVMREGRQINPS